MSENPVILCVDDEKDITDSLFDTFMYSYDVKTANSGQEALKMFDHFEIRLVISDQRMPEMTGSELFVHIKEINPLCKKILLTGYADINAAKDAINLGSVDKYFNKPWDKDELAKEVRSLLDMYDFDAYLQKMMKDSEQIISDRDDAKLNNNLFTQFFDNSLYGICIVGDNEKIGYINRTGMQMLEMNESSQAIGKKYNDLFIVSTGKLKEQEEKYSENELLFTSIDVKLSNSTRTSFQVHFTFFHENVDENERRVVGIIFSY